MTDDELMKEFPRVRERIPIGSTWRHRRGTEYFVVGHCVLAGYRVPAILCRGGTDSFVWCRPASQFADGRFSRVDGQGPGPTPSGTPDPVPDSEA